MGWRDVTAIRLDLVGPALRMFGGRVPDAGLQTVVGTEESHAPVEVRYEEYVPGEGHAAGPQQDAGPDGSEELTRHGVCAYSAIPSVGDQQAHRVPAAVDEQPVRRVEAASAFGAIDDAEVKSFPVVPVDEALPVAVCDPNGAAAAADAESTAMLVGLNGPSPSAGGGGSRSST